MEAAQFRATDAHDSAIRNPWVRNFFDDIYQFAKDETAKAIPSRDSRNRADVADELRCNVIKLRVAIEIEAIFGALSYVTPEQKHLLSNSHQGPDRLAKVEAVLATIPAAGSLLQRLAERDTAIEASNRFMAEARTTAFEAGQPERVLASIESAGTVLSYAKPRGIMATGGEISDELLASLRTYRAGIEAVLMARAAAAAPRAVV